MLGQSGQIGIRPKGLCAFFQLSEASKFKIERSRIFNKNHAQLIAVILISVPGFCCGQRSTEDFRVGAETEESKCGDAAKGDFFMGLIFPVVLSGMVVSVILVGEGEPEVDIKQIHPLRDSGGFQILPMRLISSSSSSACSSRLSRGVMRGVSGVRGMTTGGGSRCSE